LEHRENCGVCGLPLVYATSPQQVRCAFCGAVAESLINCPNGHFVCDACHGKDALAALGTWLEASTSDSPLEMLELAMTHPGVSMHGPEHHALVPAVLVAAARNSGYEVSPGGIAEAFRRGAKVPGGWCGFYGACGAGVGVGIAASVLTRATPLTGEPRRLANEATAFALARMQDGHPRCCKRASRRALAAAREFLATRLDIRLRVASLSVAKLGVNREPRCAYVARNRECVHELCPFFS
jgi:LSD1 subclass zinc finger protein